MDDISHVMLAEVRRFVAQEVIPAAQECEVEDRYPHDLVEKMKTMGLFGAIISPEYGGAGLDFSTYARIIEEISAGWMSVSGILNSHLMLCYAIASFGNDEQKRRLLPPLAAGENRGGLALTEPGAGSDVQAIQARAVRDGDVYVLNGTKMFITNGRYGNTFALLAKTDPTAVPAHRGISLFIVEKGDPGFVVGRDIKKLGYRGVETVELFFEDLPVPVANRIGEEGMGFKYVMSGLEVGRINVAARAVGVARAAFEASITYAQQRHTFGRPIAQHQAIQLKLADMATKIEASRHLVLAAAAKKDRGERCDLEAGMAKLFASETCLEVTTEALRIHGGAGYTQDLPIERYYRDAPLMIVGEGTNEIQRLVIARQLLDRYPAQ
ncbi:MAG: acyl-CoA dehydrogenase family protein [Chloroflexi bacterium]|nr:acyl-CoA dehydrogenase family protein [Chloroflexota bacterium]